jgi:phosphoserine phosphatase
MDPEEELDRLLEERKDLDIEIKDLKREISKRRGILRELGKKKRDVIEVIKVRNREANKYRQLRDELNKKVKTHKKERERHNKKVKELAEEYKKLKETVPPGNFRAMEKEINALEWKIQTRVFEIKKEDELVDRINSLKMALKDYQEILKVAKEIDRHRKESKKVHKKILKLSEESQVNHEEFLKAVEKIKELEAKIDEFNKERDEVGQGLDELKEELKVLQAKGKELDKKIKDMEIEADIAVTEKSETELKEEAKVVYERFKNGEKLDLEDIYLLRRFNLV